MIFLGKATTAAGCIQADGNTSTEWNFHLNQVTKEVIIIIINNNIAHTQKSTISNEGQIVQVMRVNPNLEWHLETA